MTDITGRNPQAHAEGFRSGIAHSASLVKGGPRRCYSCDKEISRNKWLCFSCTLRGEDCMSLIVKPGVSTDVGKIFIYACTKCHDHTFAVVRDPGLMPRIMKCRAENRNCDGSAIVVGRVPEGMREAPKANVEFYRPRGIEYNRLAPEVKELVDMGILEDRSLVEQFVREGMDFTDLRRAVEAMNRLAVIG